LAQRNDEFWARVVVSLAETPIGQVVRDEDQVRDETLRYAIGDMLDDLVEVPLLSGAILAEMEVQAMEPAQGTSPLCCVNPVAPRIRRLRRREA
jgi:hypothetical protein